MSERSVTLTEVICDGCGYHMESSEGWTATEDPYDLRESEESWLQEFDGKDYCSGCTVFNPELEELDEEEYESSRRDYNWYGLRPKSFANIDLQLAEVKRRFVANFMATVPYASNGEFSPRLRRTLDRLHNDTDRLGRRFAAWADAQLEVQS